ncbi:Hypothetical protein FKW44_020366 [Caligus rogercresseyi]|uniref:Uncharacterized protein n=1 Tax=Caligus rogercresseyi TaxID=217165 RepID=A0A7T8JZ32_CALRO|nr:Hypothetical protein FKW44_020366 [Caligus rogercresseyi]
MVRYRVATSSLYEQVPWDPKKRDAIGVWGVEETSFPSSITALKWSQSLKLWKR